MTSRLPSRRRSTADWRRACLLLFAGCFFIWPGTTVRGQAKSFAAERATGQPMTAEQLFAARVWPLFQTKCLPCHGEGKELEGGLDLRSLASARQGGDSGGPALGTGNRDSATIWRAVSRTDPEYSAMPPKENDQLSAGERESLGAWLAEGAPWPDAARRAVLAAELKSAAHGDALRVATSGGLAAEWTNRSYRPEDLWAYQPLRKPAVPAGLADHPVDAFLARRLAELPLAPAPPVDRRTLVRRATFDLLGLPPTQDEIQNFMDSPASDAAAFAALIDRLLSSPHYGEQMGRHWLDVVRYADSSGFANDYERGNAWRYRDYVVRAFNSDKPYDEFVREQIAGDELDADNPELLVAVGFLRMGPWELTGMEVAKIARQRFLDDVTDVVGQVFLAHPLQCARCHDHKFDPIPTRDYYRVQAVFATTQLTERAAPFLPTENTRGFEERAYLERRQEYFQAVLAELDKKEEAAARQWCAERGFEYVPRNEGLRRGVPEERLPPKHAGFSVEDYGRERIARKGLERLRWELDRYEPFALSVYSGPTPPLKSVNSPQRMPPQPSSKSELEKTAILAGGDPFSPTIEVTPGALSAISTLGRMADSPATSEFPTTATGRRRALAEWIVHPANPLTARVMVNRVWQWHFGQALAGNPNNFGTTGKKPSHPELLDWLAATLIEQNWSVKSLHRLIMTSDAYRRSSEHPQREQLAEKDPLGTSFAAFQPRRLAAEELRDGMLSVSGELNAVVGGIPVRPEINREVAMQPRQVMGTFAAAWQPSPLPADRHRRSLYSLKIRGLRDPFAEVFNEPSADLSCEARDVSTVTPQVFSLFNSEASYQRALAFAISLKPASASREEIIQQAFGRTFGRKPTDEESAACLDHWTRMTDRHRQLQFQPTPVPAEVVRDAVEENTGEKFQFVEPLEFARDFVPDPAFSDADPLTRGLAEVCLVLFNSNEFGYVY